MMASVHNKQATTLQIVLVRWADSDTAPSRRKETHCEFCDRELPDWKSTLTPQCGANAPAVMNVNFDGRTYSFEVKPGPEGYREFTQAIRRAFNLPEDSELNITFTCDEPSAAAEAEPMSPGMILICDLYLHVPSCPHSKASMNDDLAA